MKLTDFNLSNLYYVFIYIFSVNFIGLQLIFIKQIFFHRKDQSPITVLVNLIPLSGIYLETLRMGRFFIAPTTNLRISLHPRTTPQVGIPARNRRLDGVGVSVYDDQDS